MASDSLDRYEVETLRVCAQNGLIKREEGYSLLRSGQHVAIPSSQIDRLKKLDLVTDPKRLGQCQLTPKGSSWLNRKWAF